MQQRRPHSSSAPRHHRGKAAPAPRVSREPLLEILQRHEQWLLDKGSAPTPQALREYWLAEDQRIGPRPDYLLWRIWNVDGVRLKGPAMQETLLWRQGLAQGYSGPLLAMAAARALEARDAAPREAMQKLLLAAPLQPGAVGWLMEVALGRGSLQSLREAVLREHPSWRVGEALPMSVHAPVVPRWWRRWMIAALRALVGQDPEWLCTLWQTQLQSLWPGQTMRWTHWETLLDWGSALRLAGRNDEAGRVFWLALQVLPPRAPQALLQRARAQSWFVAESAMSLPEGLCCEEASLIFPGEPPNTALGEQAQQLYRDERDAFQNWLQAVAAMDEAWRPLRDAALVLHHPQAALAWLSRRAQAQATKGQHALLQAAAQLCLKHGLLASMARIGQWSCSNKALLLQWAQACRRAQQWMPFGRDWKAWEQQAAALRRAWCRLLDEPTSWEEEELFVLQELLLNRAATLGEALPEGARPWMEAQDPRSLAQHLKEHWRLTSALEKQRQLEWWSLHSQWRRRPQAEHQAWLSVVSIGEEKSGRRHWLLQTPKRRLHGRFRAVDAASWQMQLAQWWELLTQDVPELQCLWLATDSKLDSWPQADGLIQQVASWEALFRQQRMGSGPS